MKKALLTAIMALTATLAAVAQGQDFGMWHEIGVEKRLGSRWTASLLGEVRLIDNTHKVNRWGIRPSATYRLRPWLTATAGYELFLVKSHSLNADGTYNKRGHYTQHQANAALQASYKIGAVRLSLRERWQYDYRPQQTNRQRYDYGRSSWDGEEYVFHGNASHMLRTRLQIDHSIAALRLRPYVSVELFNAWNIQRARYTAGVDWNAARHSSIRLRYFYDDVHRSAGSTYAYNFHIIALGYWLLF